MADDLALQQHDSMQLEHVEQSASMMQQLMTAKVQSSYLIAIKRPRNLDSVRQRMLEECKRPDFCIEDPTKNGSSMAIYSVPRGNKKDEHGNWVPNLIAGPTIRFAEMALRYWGNFNVDVVPLGEDSSQRIYQVTSTDFETNVTASQIVVVPKVIERQSNKDGLPVLSQRTNSYGKAVYTLQATEEEVSMKANALISKARRNLILQSLPAWVIDDCIQQVKATAAKKDAEAPDAAKRRLYDAFATVGVTVEQLNEYLGHEKPLTPAEFELLRGLFSGIREGASTWAQIMAEKGENGPQDDTLAQIEEAFKVLEETPAKIRNLKGKYAGRSKELLAYLTDAVAKKRNDGSKKPETAAEPVKEADMAKPTEAPTTSQQPSAEATSAQQEESIRPTQFKPSAGPLTSANSGPAKTVEPEPEPLETNGW
jgi:hypothetical protein